MKTIVTTDYGISKYLLEDEVEVVFNERNSIINGEIVCDITSSNALLFDNVEAPIDWAGGKYVYNDGVWKPYNGTGGADLEEVKEFFRADLEALSNEILLLVMRCQLLLSPLPDELVAILPMVKVMYTTGKAEIEALTVDNYNNYILRGPQVSQLMGALKSFL